MVSDSRLSVIWLPEKESVSLIIKEILLFEINLAFNIPLHHPLQSWNTGTSEGVLLNPFMLPG